jgi:hypothetical protein
MNKGTRTQPVRKKLLNKTLCIEGSIAFIVMLIIIAAAPAIAFDANAIWLKGTVKMEKYKNLDPRINIDEFQIGNDEEVTLYMTYRAPARDDKKWSKVTYHVEITKPDGQLMEGINPQEEIMGGSGVVSDEHAQDWGMSHDSVGLGFSKEDARGTYLAKIIIQDHVSGEKITRATKIHLK